MKLLNYIGTKKKEKCIGPAKVFHGLCCCVALFNFRRNGHHNKDGACTLKMRYRFYHEADYHLLLRKYF